MSLHLQMVGTGSAFAKTLYNTSALLVSEHGQILIDCGASVPKALHELNIEPDQLNGIVISHIHADHVAGLEEIAFRLCYQYNNKRIKLYITEPLADILWENTLKGSMYNPQEGFTSLSNYFDVSFLIENTPAELLPGLVIEPIRTLHMKDKISYSFFINEKTFYSADVLFNEQLLLQQVVHDRGCHTILHDCQLKGHGAVHATLAELLTLPEDVQQRIYLMHYDDTMPQYIGQTGRMRFIEQHQVITLDA